MAAPKKPLRSSLIVEGLDRVPHRAFLRAVGIADEDFGKPMVGIVSQHGENTPCSMSLGPQADAARLGVAAGQGIAVPFTTISVSDGVSMNHKGMRMSLVSRELIADSIEAVVRAHCYDALVGFAGCDKTLPGVMMAMARLNCPSVFVYGGAMLPGSWRGRDVTILTAYEGVGSVLNGTMTEAELDQLGHDCAPTLGSCPGQFTANTMAMVAETLGLAMPGSAMMPAAYSQRLALARKAGRRATELVLEGGPLPRELITRKSLENATAAVAATGGSHQRRVAPARDRPRGRRALHARRRGRGLCAHAVDRQPAAGWPVPRSGPAPRGRRAGGVEGTARWWTPARRCARAVGAHAGRRTVCGGEPRRRRGAHESPGRCRRAAAWWC